MHRILIIDDTHAIHDDFRKILLPTRAAGSSLQRAKAALFNEPVPPDAPPHAFELEYALQGEEGFNKLKQAVAEDRPFAVAFVDMRMPPGWDGLKTIERMWEADAEVQVVICTAHSDHSWSEITDTLGMTDRLLILKKPFDAIEVLQLATALSEKWDLKRQATLKFGELDRLVEIRTRELEHAVKHDKLTGLPNRTLLRERLNAAYQEHLLPAGDRFDLLFLDFDRFKAVNDSLGHDAGDEMLREIGKRMVVTLRDEEWTSRSSELLAARMGGDEFVILAVGLPSAADARQLGDAILTDLAQPFDLNGYNLSTTASVGITSSEIGYDAPEGVLRDADTAMYLAKAAGKAQCVVFDEKMHHEAQQRVHLESDMRGMVERDELILHYQPVICTRSGTTRGFEALVRWNRNGKQLLMPDSFIPIAEENGAIIELGEWVLGEACRQLAQWQKTHPKAADMRMNVNVSAIQLMSVHVLDHIRDALDQSGIDPASLVIEITESAIIRDPDYTIALLHRIKEMGVQIYLDDFGTGYTSLSYLHRLPLDGLKLDRSFMSSVIERRDYASIVHAIIDLCQNLGIKVVCEGVECAEQVAMLQSMDCDLAQGYFFSRPVQADKAALLIDQNDHPNLSSAA
ncbi:MAG: EAL domain-containing protein [Phycisphaerales bacterium]